MYVTCHVWGQLLILELVKDRTWTGTLTWTCCLMRTWVLCSPHSLGVVLSQGHGEYILLGNTSVEEGRSAASKMDTLEEKNGCSWDTEQSQPNPELM